MRDTRLGIAACSFLSVAPRTPAIPALPSYGCCFAMRVELRECGYAIDGWIRNVGQTSAASIRAMVRTRRASVPTGMRACSLTTRSRTGTLRAPGTDEQPSATLELCAPRS